METPLDQALVAARQSNEKEADFYNLFLRTQLYVPTWNAPPREAGNEASAVVPVLVESEGIRFLMLFDSLQRLSSWAKEEVEYLSLPGHTIVEMMEPQNHWILNIGTPYTKEFIREEIEWLKQSLASTKGTEMSVPAGTMVLVGDAGELPPAFLSSLCGALEKNKGVRRAYIGRIHYIREEEQPHLALALDIEPLDGSTSANLRQDVLLALRGSVNEGEYVDVHAGVDQGVGSQIAAAGEPFYVRKE